MPIGKRLKKRVHRIMALAQDILVLEIYDAFPAAVIHGGTAIWRCYGSNRFSEDVDVYLPIVAKRSDMKNFIDGLEDKGLAIEKFKRTGNSIFAKLSYMGVAVRFEAVFKNAKGLIRPFEMSDGTSILVNTLSPDEMIEEKISAYAERRKVRDLYDIFFLLKFVEDEGRIGSLLREFVKGFRRPVDERGLKALIISGAVPSVDAMLEAMRPWAR
ncbi:MAG: nucleotidyl transferase AbiEii/AbiGii toxin family protein [Candidatus Bathyarchaeia archaeon]